ncbi:hypothetical protein EDD18DRAFT_1357230 [Armillaria luteobubalina]|uniref:Uncharacterized protein n=1 Tax=Armillaria luteobubalina TaxID=153913 RepID=A0AA39UU20_9AGAR|nr:hypothetical protein EDD18DRAFT_1357230 [Armillaria luteobubalina]
MPSLLPARYALISRLSVRALHVFKPTGPLVHGITPGSNARCLAGLLTCAAQSHQAVLLTAFFSETFTTHLSPKTAPIAIMLWAQCSTHSGCVFNPNPVPLSTTFAGLVSLVFVKIDSSSLFHDTIELGNKHSAEDDLDELDDIHIMPECHPTASLAPTSSHSVKCPLGAKEAGDGDTSGAEAASTPWHHKKRHLAREQKYEAEGHHLSDCTLSLIQEKAVPIHTSLVTEALPLAKGAYSTKNVKESAAEHEYSCEELLALSFTEVPWEGFDPQPIVDRQGRIVAVRPKPHVIQTRVNSGCLMFGQSPESLVEFGCK